MRINQSGGIIRNHPRPLALRLQLTQFNIDIIRDKGTTVKHSIRLLCHKQRPCYNLPPRRAPCTGTYMGRAVGPVYRCICGTGAYVTGPGRPRAMRMILICIRGGGLLDRAVIS